MEEEDEWEYFHGEMTKGEVVGGSMSLVTFVIVIVIITLVCR